jgi:hypothetical protein
MSTSSSTSCTSKRPRRSMKRRISFSPHVTVCPSLHLNDYTDDEIDACWYHQEEQAEFRDEARFTISVMEKGNIGLHLHQEKHCTTRGLEGLAAEGSQIKKLNRSLALTTVLEQQERQSQAGLRDERQLAKLYSICTFSCNIQAGLIGLADSQAVAEGAPKKQERPVVPRFLQRKFPTRIQPTQFVSLRLS